MSTGSQRSAFATALRGWRVRRRMSQLELAVSAATTQRHVSLIESDRSIPGRGMVLRLAEALDLPLRERNALLVTAGYAPAYAESAWDDPDADAVRAALQRVIDGHMPYPAVVNDRYGDVVCANDAFWMFTEGVAPQLSVGATGQRAAPLAASARDGAAHRQPRPVGLACDRRAADYLGFAVPLRLSWRDAELQLLTTLAHFGTAIDVTIAELRLEAFPAGQRRDRILARRRRRDPLRIRPADGCPNTNAKPAAVSRCSRSRRLLSCSVVYLLQAAWRPPARQGKRRRGDLMLLENKTALIYGAGGAIGGAVARTFAREGAKVFLAGRTLGPVEAVAKEIAADGGAATAEQVDALDEASVERHVAAVAELEGGIDISFNAIGIPQEGIQGTPLVELSPENFGLPVTSYALSHFLTARAAARRMVEVGSGVILTLTATPARMAAPFGGGMAAAWAAVEALSRTLAAELSPQGIRVVCLRPDAIPETATIDEVFGLHAKAAGIRREEFQAAMEGLTLRRKLPTLAEVASVAAFMASDRASAMTGTVANLSGGSIAD